MPEPPFNLKLAKYLRSRAVTDPWQLEGSPRSDFRTAIILPVLAEHATLPLTLETLAKNCPERLAATLIVVVVNQRGSAAVADKTDNRKTLEWLGTVRADRLNLAWVDACSDGLELPEKDGVGLARRLGFDLALSRLDWSGEPLLVSLDADTLVDANYLAAIDRHFRTEESSGAYLPFRHQQAETQVGEEAIRRYELYLRSYLFGLQWAGSPYAFTSIGSALACRASAYIAAGGMARRQAGEDFYFMQQLAKVGGVVPLQGTVVRPLPRISTRVPFGTGPAMQAELAGKRRLYRFVARDSFRILKDWLATAGEGTALPAATLLLRARELSPELGRFLDALDFTTAWPKLMANSAPAQRLKAWHNWFDGLRTRQLLSRLEACAPARDPAALVAELLEAGGCPRESNCNRQLQYLESLQGVPAG